MMMLKLVLGSWMVATALSQSTQPANSRDVQIAADGTLVATSKGKGPLQLRVPGASTITVGLSSLASMDAISISDEGFLVGLSVYTPAVCSFRIVSGNLAIIGCISGQGISVSDFTGISAKGGTCVISGGSGGYTVIDYDRDTGILNSQLRCMNCKVDTKGEFGDLNYFDVELQDSRWAALSSVSSNNDVFVSLIVDLNNNQYQTGHIVPVGISGDLAVTPANYPFVDSFYRSTSGEDYMFSACGSITVQLALTANSPTTIDPPVQNFVATLLMVDSARDKLVVGGRLLGSSYIAIYSIDASNPRTVSMDSADMVEGTLLSLAVRDGNIAYVTAESTDISTFVATPQPSVAPSIGVVTPVPSGSSLPSFSPSGPPQSPTIRPDGPTGTQDGPTGSQDGRTSAASENIAFVSTSLMIVISTASIII